MTDSFGNSFRQRYTLNVLPVGTVIPAFTLIPGSINISYTRGDPAPAPIPISVGSVSTPLAYTVSTSGYAVAIDHGVVGNHARFAERDHLSGNHGRRQL